MPVSYPTHYARALAEKRAMRKAIRELLDCYWGAGDGSEPPDFIKRAARLAGWKHKGPKRGEAAK